jgi:hypothetical protein
MGWLRHIEEDLEIWEVEGTHLGIISKPNVTGTAKKIKDRIG